MCSLVLRMGLTLVVRELKTFATSDDTTLPVRRAALGVLEATYRMIEALDSAERPARMVAQ